MARNESAIYNELRNAVVATGIVKTVNPNSVLGIMLRAIARTIAHGETEAEQKLLTALSVAGGELLDAIGQVLGVTRIPETPVEYVSNIEFYVTTGVLADYIDETFFVNGIEVKTPDGSLVVKIQRNIDASLLGAPSIQLDGKVVSRVPSKRSLAVNELTVYSPSVTGVYVRNTAPQNLVLPEEDDATYRYRIATKMARIRGATPIAVRSAVLGVTGIADVVVKDGTTGFGTFNVYIVGTEMNSESALIPEVQEALADIVPPGIAYNIMPAPKLYVQIEAEIIAGTDDATVRQAVTSAVNNAVYRYINNLPMGSTISKNELSRLIVDAHDAVASVKKLNVKLSLEDEAGNIYTDYMVQDTYTPADIVKPATLTETPVTLTFAEEW